jgi:hypothetical protein
MSRTFVVGRAGPTCVTPVRMICAQGASIGPARHLEELRWQAEGVDGATGAELWLATTYCGGRCW